MKESKNSMQPVDVGCGRLIPQGNLDPKVPGSLGNMLQQYYSAKPTYKASTPYGFTPGFTAGGVNYPWGEVKNGN